MKKLVDFVRKIQSEERFAAFDEAAIKQAIILKSLSLLNWDPFDVDEVQPGCEIGNGRVDFSLRHNDGDKVFVFVKKDAKNFSSLQEKVLHDAMQGKAEIAILTDGMTWWMFLPRVDGRADERRFHAIDMKGQSAEEISEKLEEFLSKENVISGKARKTAESIYEERQRNRLVEEYLPKAWQEIISEPEKWLVNLVADVTKDLCGYKPERERVQAFLSDEVQARADLQHAVLSPPSQPLSTQAEKSGRSGGSDDFTGKSITAFKLLGKRYEVKSWKAMFLKICDVVLPKQKKDELEVLFTIATPQREYFSKNPYEFLAGEKIPGTSVYVDTNLNAREVVDLSQKILMLFGHRESDLSIEVK